MLGSCPFRGRIQTSHRRPDKIRVTVICPGVTEPELADSISDEAAATR
jgi:NADP-dependent 3-hydroxy acid dehydrogenase YdfG